MELMVFNFLDGNYAIDLQRIKAILVYSQVNITPLHDEKPWVSGLINLRGDVAPVVDLRVRFSDKAPSFDADTIIIIVKTSQDKLIGITVDKIESITEIEDITIFPTPELGVGIDSIYITGLCKVQEHDMLTILDIDKILQISELS